MTLPKRKVEELEVNKNYESRLTRLETIMEFINCTLEELKVGQANIMQRIQRSEDKVDEKLVIINNNIQGLDAKIETVRKETWSQTRWVLGFIFAVLASPHAAGFVTKLIEQFTQ